MLKENPSALERDELPEVAVEKRRGISLVWLIPLVAGAIAIWLGYTTLQEKGPTITVVFDDAEGLEAGKTRVKYRDVEVGLVDQVALSEDLSHIVVTASLDKSVATHMKAGTRFWIVRPRIGLGGISGLGTLLSGVFIEFDPGDGQPAHEFVGLAEPPPITSRVPGTQFVLRTDRLGSIGRGSPVYYHNIAVGQVLGYELAEDKQDLVVNIFVDAPNDQLVRPGSRFWNASGVDVSLGADGVEVSMESLQALLAGGIAFDTPDIDQPGEPAAAATAFPLFASLRDVTEAGYTERIPYLVQFDGSVRGLRAGAPVEFRGIRVGSVTDVRLEIDPEQDTVRIPVTLEIEPQRIGVERGAGEQRYAVMAALVERGLRAQLKSGNLLTGELLVDLDFHPQSPAAQLDRSGTYPAIPAVPAQLEALTASVTTVLSKLAALPLPELIDDLRRTVQGIDALVASPDTKSAVAALNQAAVRLEALIGTLDQRVGPLFVQAQSTLAAADGMVGANSQVRYDLNAVLKELTGAARSIRVFADYLERHPEALLRGKAGAP
ncbi:MAG: intermembrane transport protein PqiB [Geminicoccaceae bacterium]